MATANPQDFLNLGYKNGQIPLCALKDVPGQPGIKLHPAAADQMKDLLIAAQRDGISFRISNGYRDYDTQVDVKAVQGRGAATPGQSKHGWGTTIDISELYRLAESTAADFNRAGQRVDRFTPSVHKHIRETSRLYQWLNTNAPKYGWVNPSWAKTEEVGKTVNECWHWEFQIWPTVPDYVQFKPTVAPVTIRCGDDTPIRTKYVRSATGTRAPESSITPYIASIESFHPRIQYELTRRRISAETVTTYMPFVRLTSLTKVLGENLQGGANGSMNDAWCPSLGPHGEDIVEFNDIYLPQKNRSFIGYATKKATQQTSDAITYTRVPVIVEEKANNTDQQNIPMPGIVEVNAERGTAGPMGVRGGLMKADLKIIAYSVGQVDALLRYFLRPATRVVLEWGRQSSNKSEEVNPYDWGRSAEFISNQFTRLIKDKDAQEEFIRDYIYANNGNYEIFIGYVVKFDLKYNKNNTYDISLTVHSVQQFEIPTRQTGVKSTCSDAVDKCAAMDVHEYFAEEYSWKQRTFKKLMTREENAVEQAKNSGKVYEWGDDFIALRNPNTADVGGGSKEAGMTEGEYLVSWQFFIDKILNDDELGIVSTITDKDTRENIKTGLLKSTKGIATIEDNKLFANEVGYHPNLRSTNPNVMIVYNPTAQSGRSQSEQQNFQNLINASITTQEERTNFTDNTQIENFITGSGVGSFDKIVKDKNTAGVSSLTYGVWINTQAIKQAFTSNDTISSAINSLLMMMNSAVEGYWNLQLYSADRPNPGMFVIDYGMSKPLIKNTGGDSIFPWIDKEESETSNILSSINDVTINRYQKSNEGPGKDEPQYIYMFNRGTKRFNDGELGSDLLDINVEFNLPQVIAVQAIANVGGSAQKSSLQSIDVEQLVSMSLITNIFAPCNPGNVCFDQDCNDQDLVSLQSAFDAASVAGSPTSAASGSIGGQLVQRAYGNTMVIDNVRQLSSLGTLLNLVEFNPAAMVKKLNLDSRNAEEGRKTPYAHAFNSSNLTKTIASVTLPGIGGIELFQSFLIDRVPSILERGFYVVTKVIHKFSSSNGWTTTIEGRFRYRPENENTATGPYEKKCVTAPAGTSPPAVPPSPAQRPSPFPPGLSPSDLAAATPEKLVSLLEKYEQLVDEPFLPSIARKQDWDNRVKSGQVNKDRNTLEYIKDEIRKRNAANIRQGKGIDRAFFSLSERRLRPR